MAKSVTQDNEANMLANPDWLLATGRRRKMRGRKVTIDTEAEFNMPTEFGADFQYLLNHPDNTVRVIAKRMNDRWWNTLNQHRECNLYREEMTFHEIERLNIATFCMALMRAIYKTNGHKTKHKFMGHSLSQMVRPLGYLVMGLIAKDHQGAHPGHLYTSILHDIRMLSDKKERLEFYRFFNSHTKKFFEDSGLITHSTSYRKTNARRLVLGKEFGINHRLVLKPQARALVEEFIDNFKQECEALSKEAVIARNEYIHEIGKISSRRVYNPMDDIL